MDEKVEIHQKECFRCHRMFDVSWDKENGKMEGTCPVCKTHYDIKLTKLENK